MPVVYSYSYNKGLKKTKNEDAINIAKNNDNNLISIICDGVSSHKNSSFSSNYIVKELTKKWKKSSFISYDNMKDWILDNILLLNKEIINKSKKQNQKMATTLLVTIIYEDKILIINVGDSLSYGLTTDNKMKLLAKDDSFVGVLLDAGVITAEEATIHPKRHTLTQAIGVDEDIEIHINEESIENFDYILNCSDGLTTMLDDEEISNIIISEDLSNAVNMLIEKSNERGGVDNISISLFKILRGVQDDR
ncbi:serine/threonine-protein phosphatase [Gemella sp. GH3]|uniref:protein phosphatase 2C domain-containing protein n=1 Tax=unclassified Gemella TaxID=2624949 RepID=UPI0015CF9DB2|nr:MULTISPECIES: protein phosphatase 2C domain-containing protein [unclassified Gemella]MBF0714380.1 serine/threonine-protein phosphatase [Gemella sp. GH3.1]NYS51332.1 serine/threonine-protein phosphatase [Gemella sp. GH3]